MSSTRFESELSSALRENSFGLKGYQVIQETQLESLATIVLLEGHQITVSLTPRGFEVSDKKKGVFYETLEQLLDSQSPAFRLESHKALFSRLEEFANVGSGDQGDHVAGSTVNDE